MAYTVVITNPIVSKEVMRIETDNELLAMSEAAQLSRLHGIAVVYDPSNLEVARFRYGTEQLAKA
jgi:hypothetical protein